MVVMTQAGLFLVVVVDVGFCKGKSLALECSNASECSMNHVAANLSLVKKQINDSDHVCHPPG